MYIKPSGEASYLSYMGENAKNVHETYFFKIVQKVRYYEFWKQDIHKYQNWKNQLKRRSNNSYFDRLILRTPHLNKSFGIGHWFIAQPHDKYKMVACAKTSFSYHNIFWFEFQNQNCHLCNHPWIIASKHEATLVVASVTIFNETNILWFNDALKK